MVLKELFTDIGIFLVMEPDMESKPTLIQEKGWLAQHRRLSLLLAFSNPESTGVHTDLHNHRQDVNGSQTVLASNPSSATAFFDLLQTAQH